MLIIANTSALGFKHYALSIILIRKSQSIYEFDLEFLYYKNVKT